MRIASLPRPPELDHLLADFGRAVGAARASEGDRLARALEATTSDASEAVRAMRAYSEELSFAAAMLTPENVARVRRDGRLLVARLETARSLQRCSTFDDEMPRELESLHALLDSTNLAVEALEHPGVTRAMKALELRMRELDEAIERAREKTRFAIQRLAWAASALAPDADERAKLERDATARARMHQEMERFRAALPELARLHPGRWVVFLDGRVRSTHDDPIGAYAAAVAELGPSAGFVVAPVADERPIRLSRGAARIFGPRAG